jgi:hypothetical protein
VPGGNGKLSPRCPPMGDGLTIGDTPAARGFARRRATGVSLPALYLIVLAGAIPYAGSSAARQLHGTRPRLKHCCIMAKGASTMPESGEQDHRGRPRIVINRRPRACGAASTPPTGPVPVSRSLNASADQQGAG